MSKEIIGYLVTEADALGSRKRLQGFRVAVRLPGSLFDYKGGELGSGVSEDGGRFQLNARRSPSLGVRHLEIVAYDKAGRELTFAPSDADFPGYSSTTTAARASRIAPRNHSRTTGSSSFVRLTRLVCWSRSAPARRADTPRAIA